MNITDAAYAVVHDYPGGSESLAPRLGMVPAVLRNKVNPNNDTHHLTLREAVRITQMTNDNRLLHAINAECNHVAIEAAEEGEPSDMAILELMAGVWSRNGELGESIRHALVDGELSEGEFLKISEAGYRLRHKILRLIRRLKALVEPAGKAPK